MTAVDACLADDRFFEPYRQRFHTLIGRPTVPVETYLRLMYLKHRYRLGYETLVRLRQLRRCEMATLQTHVPRAMRRQLRAAYVAFFRTLGVPEEALKLRERLEAE